MIRWENAWQTVPRADLCGSNALTPHLGKFCAAKRRVKRKLRDHGKEDDVYLHHVTRDVVLCCTVLYRIVEREKIRARSFLIGQTFGRDNLIGRRKIVDKCPSMMTSTAGQIEFLKYRSLNYLSENRVGTYVEE